MKNLDYCNFFTLYKNSEKTYYQRNRETIINRVKENYENNKEVLREKARNKYRELSENEKDIRREHGRNRYKNMSGKNKQTLKEYPKNFRKAKKLT